MEKCNKPDLEGQQGKQNETELDMKDQESQNSDQGEENQEEGIQQMEMEKVEINLESLRKDHGEQEIDEMTIGQIKHLHQETQECKGKEIELGF
jgi:hypothetical protein